MEDKVAQLRRLAAEGFRQIEQGQGIDVPSERHLSAHVAKLGRRAARIVRA
jgi:hypothetical protein